MNGDEVVLDVPAPSLPLSGSTQVENEDAAEGLVMMTNLLAGNSRVQVWWSRLLEGGLAEDIREGSIEAGPLIEEAAGICRELRLPSRLIGASLAWTTLVRGLEQVVDRPLVENLWAAPKGEEEIRRNTEAGFTAALRSLADSVEGGTLAAVPWPEYFDSLSTLLAAPALAIERGRSEANKLKPGRRRRYHPAVKAFCVYLKRVGGEDGPVPVHQIAGEAVDLGILETDDSENARRSVNEWIDYMERLLLLKPPTV